MSFSSNATFEKTVQQKIIVPQIYNKIWDNPVIESDLRNTEIAKLLDYSGIDKIIKHGRGKISGLAQRIQRKKYAKWKSITIREMHFDTRMKKTLQSEFEKTKEAIESGAITAAYQSQFYVNADHEDEVTGVLDGIIVKRLDFWDWMRKNPARVRRNVTGPLQNGGSLNKFQTFFYVRFADIPQEITIYKHEYQNGNNHTLDEFSE